MTPPTSEVSARLIALRDHWETEMHEDSDPRVDGSCSVDGSGLPQRASVVVSASVENEDIEAWLISKGFVPSHAGTRDFYEIAWSRRSGYDFALLRFCRLGRPAGAWDAVMGCHASGTNPAIQIGRCDTFDDVQAVYDLMRRINGYPSPEPERTTSVDCAVDPVGGTQHSTSTRDSESSSSDAGGLITALRQDPRSEQEEEKSVSRGPDHGCAPEPGTTAKIATRCAPMPVNPDSFGPTRVTCGSCEALKRDVEGLLNSSMKMDAQIDAVWSMIEQGWDIESREYFERESQTNGFKYGLAQAVHHMWKRCVKDNPPFLRAAAPAPQDPPRRSSLFYDKDNQVVLCANCHATLYRVGVPGVIEVRAGASGIPPPPPDAEK